MTRLPRATLLLTAALLAGAPLLAAAPARAQDYGYATDITATTAPPPLVEYDQPPIPAPGYIWTPGYWAWGPVGYYWVPGTWVLPPTVGLLWTPPWWGFVGGRYLFHVGYWGPTVGFYGGINYGFGYFGIGFEGGYWHGGTFFYNGAYNHFGGVHITNVYTKNVTNITNVTINNRASFNGPGGITRQPTPAEQAALRAPHVQPTPAQQQHIQLASQNRELAASVNHGRPPITAVSRPAGFAPHPAEASRPAIPAPHGESAPVGMRPPAPPGTFHTYPAPGAYRPMPAPGGFHPPGSGYGHPGMAPPPRPEPRPAPEGRRPPG